MSDDCAPTGITRTWEPTPSARVAAFFAAMTQLTLPGFGDDQTDDTDPTPPAGVDRHLRLIQGDRK